MMSFDGGENDISDGHVSFARVGNVIYAEKLLEGVWTGKLRMPQKCYAREYPAAIAQGYV